MLEDALVIARWSAGERQVAMRLRPIRLQGNGLLVSCNGLSGFARVRKARAQIVKSYSIPTIKLDRLPERFNGKTGFAQQVILSAKIVGGYGKFRFVLNRLLKRCNRFLMAPNCRKTQSEIVMSLSEIRPQGDQLIQRGDSSFKVAGVVILQGRRTLALRCIVISVGRLTENGDRKTKAEEPSRCRKTTDAFHLYLPKRNKCSGS